MTKALSEIARDLSTCSICKERFSATATRHGPKPIVWFKPGARILIASQAPGQRAHNSGKPFYDPSGIRLRAWMGVDEPTFYDRSRIAIVPMAFCFPGYDAKGSDLPPPSVCAKTWRTAIFDALGDVRLKLLIGGYAQKWHLDETGGVTETVRRWRDAALDTIPLPHPSWRNTAWLKKNPWFEEELLPVLRDRVKGALA